MHLDDVFAGLGNREINHPRPPFDQQITSGVVGNHHGCFQLRIDPPRGTIDHNPLPLPGFEPVMVGPPGRNHRIADRVQFQFLGGRHAGVARHLHHLGQTADSEHPARRQPQAGHHLRLIQPGLALRRDRDRVLVGDRLAVGVEFALGDHLRRTEDQFLGPVEMLARNCDVDSRSLGAPHRKRRQQPGSGKTDRLRHHNARPAPEGQGEQPQPETRPDGVTSQV